MGFKSWLSLTAWRNWSFRHSFSSTGLKSTTTDLGGDTVMHCWVPKLHNPSKSSLLLIHGIGANVMWQWGPFISPLAHHFNLFIPDLLFFVDSHSTRPDRSERFQAECAMAVVKAHGVRNVSVVGLSCGGFVAYNMAAAFPESVEKVVVICAGVSLEDRDMEEGMFKMKTVDEVVEVLLPRTPEMVKQLVQLTFAKPIKVLPNCFLNDFIEVMCTEYRQEKKELIQALHKDRKLSNLPKITQPMQIIWGEQDLIFPLELAHRLKRNPFKKKVFGIIYSEDGPLSKANLKDYNSYEDSTIKAALQGIEPRDTTATAM